MSAESENEEEIQSGEHESEETKDEGGISYQPPISAIPPRVTLTEESQMEVSASPAFQCLDDVSYAISK